VQVQFNFGGSQTLRTQIEQGAAADVFASANLKELDSLIDAGFAAAGAGQIFLTNQLVVILPEGNPGKVLSLQDLARPGVRLVFAAKEAPVGSYTLTVLANLESAFGPGYPQQVLHQVGSYEGDAKQVVAKVRLGEADAGIAYRSDAAAAPELLTLAIPNEANVAARYPIAPLLQSKQPELAQAFIGYVLSNAGQAVLQKWGFQPGP
jgi:molybdate transport system substrate-binding protein